VKAEIRVGDALSQLKTLDEQSVHCVITSPPYWGLRAYHGDTGMIGLEPTWDEHLAGLMAVFDEVWRVLRKDGTIFVNYGDAYTGGGRGKGSDLSKCKQGTNTGSISVDPVPANALGLPPKNLMMMPARFALAMQERGWILRSEIVWAKKNSMPESATDRPTCAHEKVFMFAKQKKYYYDHIAVRTQEKESSTKRYQTPYNTIPHALPGSGQHTGIHDFHNRRMKESKNKLWPGIGVKHANERNRGESSKPMQVNPGANMRNVLHLASSPYKGAHFATYPPALIEPFIKAGTSAHGVCPHCGAPWERIVSRPVPPDEVFTNCSETKDGLVKMPYSKKGKKRGSGQKLQKWREENPDRTTGWQPTCSCPDNVPVPATVMDIFAGSGTTGVVANRLGRDALLIEISQDYADMARKRLDEDRFHALNYQKNLLDEIGV